MSQQLILDLTLKALMLVMILSMPPIIMATFTGLAVSLFQALTQIQEQTLGFAVKLTAVVVTMILAAGWMTTELLSFGDFIFQSFPRLTH